MAGEQIVLTVGADGTIHAETKGMKGKRCLDSVELLEDLLAAQAVSSAFTAEYDQATDRVDEEVDDEQHQSDA
jgi:hypothetical protein